MRDLVFMICYQVTQINTRLQRPSGPRHEKTCLWGFANNKGTDQPAHMCSLISALLDSMIFKLAIGEIPIFYLVSVAETGWSLALSETPETGFLCPSPSTNCHGEMLNCIL